MQIVQNTSDDLVNYYKWINEDGQIIWSSDNTVNSNTDITFNQGTEKSLIEKSQYFSIPKETLKPYIENHIDPTDNTLKWYISYPIIIEKENKNKTDSSINRDSIFNTSSNNKEFRGILTAVIKAETLGKFLYKQTPLKYDASIDIFKRDGTVLYSDIESIIGKNIFDSEFQKIYPIHSGEYYNSFYNSSLYEIKSGIFDLYDRQNKILSIAYQPIFFESKQIKQNHQDQFGTLYVNAPNNLAMDVLYMLEQQRIFSILVYITITLIAAGISLTIIIWNRRLKHIINLRTSELIQSNKKLQLSNEKLKMNDKLQKEFINIAAHELRTPTQIISGYTDLLIDYLKKNSRNNNTDDSNNNNNNNNNSSYNVERISTVIEPIIRNVDRLQLLTNNILNVERIESNNLNLFKEKFDLNEQIINVIKDIEERKLIKNNNVKIIFDKPNKPIYVFADRKRIIQVLYHLLDNSIKFTKDGSITLSMQINNRVNKFPINKAYHSTLNNDIQIQEIFSNSNNINNNCNVLVTIKDTGTGINPEIMPRLFDKFSFKSDNGLGLGLYISKNIINSHGCNLFAENNSNEKGTTFTFTLPLSNS